MAHEPADDNARVLRYLAKITAEPARTHGIHDEVGSLAPGHLADLVLWDAASFGAKPVAVMKGGVVAWGPIGEGNASVHGSEPTRFGLRLGRHGRRGGGALHHVRLRRRARGGHRSERSPPAAGSSPSLERGASDAPI
jgi:urease alpha subunit